MGYSYTEHKSAFNAYVRRGVEADLNLLETKALSDGSDTDGGYLIPSDMEDEIVAKVANASAMRSLASVHEIPATGWTTETGGTTNTTIAKKSIPVHEIFAQLKATQKILDDSSVDVEAWLAATLAEGFASLEGTAFITGNGSGKPKGILDYASGTTNTTIQQIASGTSGVVEADSLIQLVYSLESVFVKNATFLMNRQTIEQVRMLKEATTGQYLWNPGLVGEPDTLLGIPIMEDNNMPAPGADSLSIALADFKKAYKIVDKTGVRILRDTATEKPFVKFYATKHVGGDVINTEAIKILRLGV